jgi:hypothetical protein
LVIVERVETLIVTVGETTALDENLNKRNMSSLMNSSMAKSARELILVTLSLLEQFQLIPGGKYPPTGEDIRVALIRTFLADCSSRDVKKRMVDIFDIRDPSTMLNRFEQFERCFVQEDGELRLLF